MNYNPGASSLIRQAWQYQQWLDEETGPWMGDQPMMTAPALEPPTASQIVFMACANHPVASLAGAGAVGYAAGRWGVLPALLGAGTFALWLKYWGDRS